MSTRIFLLFLALAEIGACPLHAEASGTVGGTVVLVSGTAPSLRTVGYGAGMTLILDCNGSELKRIADENGDFQISLPAGKWHLVRVLDGRRREVAIERTQSRDFDVRDDQHTRFDVMVRRPPN